jgi:class 3 adenylate cyclase
MIWISESVWTVRDQDGNLMFFEGTVEDITERKQTEAELRHQRQDAERLLLNIFPQMIAERLKRQRGTIAENYDNVTVLFADVVNFTALSGRISAKELVSLLNRIFSAFDQLAQRYGVEKIKTIGDGYMAAAGVPARRPNHPQAIAEMAIAMQETITQFLSDDGQPFQLRIGISTGPVVAGVIGTSRFSFDLWGETVNLASRMQTLGLPGEIQVTAATYEALKAEWDLEERGLIEVKGVGAMRTFLLKGKKPYRVEVATAAEALSPISPTSSISPTG